MIFLISDDAFGNTNNSDRNPNESKVATAKEESVSASVESTEGATKSTEERAVPTTAVNPSVQKLEPAPQKEVLQDSTNVNSLSKFNFVFYFIYKLKYNAEPTGNEYLDFQF